MILYALRHVKKDILLSVSASYNGDEAEFCNTNTVEFEDDIGATAWVTNDRAIAEAALITNMPWYNSDSERPVNPFVGELEIVEFHMAEK